MNASGTWSMTRMGVGDDRGAAFPAMAPEMLAMHALWAGWLSTISIVNSSTYRARPCSIQRRALWRDVYGWELQLRMRIDLLDTYGLLTRLGAPNPRSRGESFCQRINSDQPAPRLRGQTHNLFR